MFGNAYQNGPLLEVWDARVDPSKHFLYPQLAKTNSTHPRAFDKATKNYLYSLQGLNTKITLPAQDSQHLALHQRYLVIQIEVPLGTHWWMELGFTDLTGTRRRVNLTTVQGKQEGKYFSYRYPLEVTRETWLFLGVDLYSFMEAFKGQTFRALDHIAVGSSCRLRRIFTMKDFIEYQIPKSFWLPHEISQSLELVSFNPQKEEGPFQSKLLSESVPLQREPFLKESPNKKKENKSLVALDNRRQGRPSRSPEDIIGKARQRLESLEKEEELLLQRSQKLEDSPPPNKKAKYRHTEASPAKVKKEKHIQRKLPPLERSFQEDEALNIKGDSSSGTNYRREDLPAANRDGLFPSTAIYGGDTKGSPKELDLIYDEMVGCYYHPETNTYFELRP